MKRNLYLEFLGRGLSINRYNTMLIVSYICLLYNKPKIVGRGWASLRFWREGEAYEWLWNHYAPITGDDRGYRFWSIDSAYLPYKKQIALRYRLVAR